MTRGLRIRGEVSASVRGGGGAPPQLAFTVMAETNRQIRLKKRPVGMPTRRRLRTRKRAAPHARRRRRAATHHLPLTRSLHARADERCALRTRRRSSLATSWCGHTVSQVVESRNPSFKTGDIVTGYDGWQEYASSNGKDLRKLDGSVPMSTAIGVLGMPGMTAFVGLLDIGQPKPGETVVVSAASGAVGSIVGQLAKTQGMPRGRRGRFRRQVPLRGRRARVRCVRELQDR